jgi:hypothetical protein
MEKQDNGSMRQPGFVMPELWASARFAIAFVNAGAT